MVRATSATVLGQSTWERRRFAPSPSRHRRVLNGPRAGLRIVKGNPRSPFHVGDERGPKLRIIRKLRIVGSEAEKRREAEPLLRGDPEPAMVGEHALVSAQFLRVARFATEDFTPPSGDVRSMLLTHPAREEARQQLVVLDPIVERVYQASDRLVTTRPFVERLRRLRYHVYHLPRLAR